MIIPKAERYFIDSNSWVRTMSTPPGSDLVQGGEIGPAILMPDGRTVAIGASGHTAIYNAPWGLWTAGPDFPKDSNGNLLQAFDAPACLLPNGKVLCLAGPPLSTGWAGPPSAFSSLTGLH